MISGQNIITFSCQKTNLGLVVDNAYFNIRTCFQINNISKRVPDGKTFKLQ